MGNTLSLVSLALSDFLSTLDTYRALKHKVSLSPGLPRPNPTLSFWAFPPSPIARHISELPVYADYVVIGSGITGTSFAQSLLRRISAAGGEGAGVKVVMLEARDACSGATGRNGGHISPPLYQDYPALLKAHGPHAAQRLIRFRLAHLHALRAAAAAVPGLLAASQWREVETVDAFYDRGVFEKAVGKLQQWSADMPTEAAGHRVWHGLEAAERFGLADDVVGCISSTAGAIHPYRFVTGILADLLARYPDDFHLLTHTPCTSIAAPSDSTSFYTVTTPRGQILTPHIIHATNGWASHLLAPLRAKIVPFRGNMTAQRPGRGLTASAPQISTSVTQLTASVPHEPALSVESPVLASTPHPLQFVPGSRSFIFYTSPVGYDYLTQLPASGDHGAFATDGEMMLGGGFATDGEDGMANVDDGACSQRIGAHLGGALPRYFGAQRWGAEGSPRGESAGSVGASCGEGLLADSNVPAPTARADQGEGEIGHGDEDTQPEWYEGRVKAAWSGVLGISADMLPWVGRLPPRVSGRAEPRVSESGRTDSRVSGARAASSVGGSPSSETSRASFSQKTRKTLSRQKQEQEPSPENARPLPQPAVPGEWIAAGYSGEGMVHAWLSGTALAGMVSGVAEAEDGMFPCEVLSVTEKRWKRAKAEDLLDLFRN
ncbi:FAD dependent oxidoreductase [Leucogyrophana mollusca]|uniref:FAD dependent oxidoreductase n=1 Tax=Leucogyrophana mollusca TaxID=85980 RepID=A0ACB8B6C9_9AGAM|nr:FAD dependent oxidoreductase [Leucogyrophana mollusca]